MEATFWNTFYVASKAGDPEAVAQVNEITQGLISLGYYPSYNWTGREVRKPYTKFREENTPIARDMVKAVKASGIVIIRYAEYMTGGNIETGIALGDATTALGNPQPIRPGKKLFVVGNGVEDKSIFYLLEPFLFAPSTKALLEVLGPAKPLP